MKILLPVLLALCLLAACERRQPSPVGIWESKTTFSGVVQNRNIIGSSLELADDQTFKGEIRDRELIVATSGKFSLDGDILSLTGTQTLIRSAGKGVVGSSKPYTLPLKFEGDKLTNLNVVPSDDMEIVYERTN